MVGTVESLPLENPGAVPLVQEDHTKELLKVDFPHSYFQRGEIHTFDML